MAELKGQMYLYMRRHVAALLVQFERHRHTVVGHDISFSRLSRRRRRALVAVLAPITWLAYAAHRPRMRGTETASAWRKPAHSG
jgi:CHASE2 domain-containing sensor protein